MATRNRRSYFRQAIRYFERQSYSSKELVIVDDGEIPVADLCDGSPSVHYIRLDRHTETGTKLNIGVRHAQGSILQKLDDDDYYSPDFLATSVQSLPAENRDKVLVARDCFLVLLAGEQQLRFSGHGWTAGGTFCFGRELWERKPFRDLSGWADYAFLQDHGLLGKSPWLVRVCAPEQYWLVRHGANTWKMMSTGDTADEYMRRLTFHDVPFEAMLDPEDCAFYRSLVPWVSLPATIPPSKCSP
jgi:glycosyltransferase involved in cell wall biosynthesis